MKVKVLIYWHAAQWRWRVRAAKNGKIIGASSEGYSKRCTCLNNLQVLLRVNLPAKLPRHGNITFKGEL